MKLQVTGTLKTSGEKESTQIWAEGHVFDDGVAPIPHAIMAEYKSGSGLVIKLPEIEDQAALEAIAEAGKKSKAELEEVKGQLATAESELTNAQAVIESQKAVQSALVEEKGRIEADRAKALDQAEKAEAECKDLEEKLKTALNRAEKAEKALAEAGGKKKIICRICGKDDFKNEQGKAVHMRRSHPGMTEPEESSDKE
nr:hypothetical protein 11 [bacterium]